MLKYFLPIINFSNKNKDLLLKIFIIFFISIISFILGHVTKTCNFDKKQLCEIEIEKINLLQHKDEILTKEMIDLKKSFIFLEEKSNNLCNRKIDNERLLCNKKTSEQIEIIKKEFIKQKCKLCK